MSTDLTAKERTEKLVKKQRALGKRMRKKGQSILNRTKEVRVHGDTVLDQFKREREQQRQNAVITLPIKKVA